MFDHRELETKWMGPIYTYGHDNSQFKGKQYIIMMYIGMRHLHSTFFVPHTDKHLMALGLTCNIFKEINC